MSGEEHIERRERVRELMDNYLHITNRLLHAEYRVAKTMPNAPHSYTRRKEWESDQDFVDAVEYIRICGVTKMWGGRPYRYLILDGLHYWTMGYPIHPKADVTDWKNETILINRAVL